MIDFAALGSWLMIAGLVFCFIAIEIGIMLIIAGWLVTKLD